MRELWVSNKALLCRSLEVGCVAVEMLNCVREAKGEYVANKVEGKMVDGSGLSFASIANSSQRCSARIDLRKINMGVLTLCNDSDACMRSCPFSNFINTRLCITTLLGVLTAVWFLIERNVSN